MFDAIFIGAGVVSLAAAYNYKKLHPNNKILVLEKQAKVGGRAISKTFCGVRVQLGAGVGRYEKDMELLNLLNELNIHHTIHPKRIMYHPKIKGKRFVQTCLQGIARRLSTTINRDDQTFRSLAIDTLGNKKYQDFLDSAGFTDFEHSSPHDIMHNYGVDDLVSGGNTFSFSWHELVNKLSKQLDLVCNSTVYKIHNNKVYSTTGIYSSKEIFVGLTAKPLQSLFPAHFGGLQAQPFLRVYARLNKPLPISHYTVVGRPLQKIIPLRGLVYMVAYSDNDSALILKNKGAKTIEKMLQHLFDDRDIRVLKMLKHFWQEGTHYWEPSADKTMPNGIHFIGEAVNDEQGWTGPALAMLQSLQT